MSLSSPWGTTPSSDTKLNLMTIPSDTGDNLATYDKTKFKIVVCTETGSGFTVDHVYLFGIDGTTVIDITSVSDHTHVGTNDGGKLTDIFIANSLITILQLTKTTDLVKASWKQTVTGTGSIEDTIDGTTGEYYIRLRPNGTSGSGSTIQYPHMSLNFQSRSMYQAKLLIENDSSIALHSGVNADDVTASDSNTVKYNAEVCTATNNNWFLRTANGTNNSASDSGIAMSTNQVAIKILHYPGIPECDLYIDAGDVLQKTTYIPTTSTSDKNNIVKQSVKNSTGADRPLRFYGAKLSFEIDDAWV